MFWSTAGIATYSDIIKFMKRVSEGKLIITVHRAPILSLSSNTAALSNGISIPVDAVVCCTGWKHAQPDRFSTSLCSKLDLPLSINQVSPETASWLSLDIKAEDYICGTFLMLANPSTPIDSSTSSDFTPFHLYRHIAPPIPTHSASECNIIFLDTSLNVQIPVYN